MCVVANEDISENHRTWRRRQVRDVSRARVVERDAMDDPIVFLDIAVGARPVGRIEIALSSNVAPRTCENFRALCTGERASARTREPLHFKESSFHRVIPGFMAQGGDFTRHNGTGGESIYGEKFKDENFELKHDAPGVLSMANSGPNTNGSQFFILFEPAPHLDGKHVVFGRVVHGLEVLEEIQAVGSASGATKEAVLVVDSGQLS